MAGGLGFAGGLWQGIQGATQMQQAQQELNIRQQAADQAAWKFNQEKTLDTTNNTIADEQAQASADNDTAQQNANTAMAANATPTPANTPITEDDGVTPVKDADGNIQYATTATAPADPNAIATAYGVKAPDAINYQYGMKRVAALQKAGQWDQANKLQNDTKSNVAGSFMSATSMGDDNAAANLWNIMSPVHGGQKAASFHTVREGEDGRIAGTNPGDIVMQFANSDGTNSKPVVVPQYKAMTAAASWMNPAQGVELLKSDRALQAEAAWKKAMLEGQNQRNLNNNDTKTGVAGLNNATRLVTNANTVEGRLEGTAMNLGGKGGKGSSSGGTGGGTGVGSQSGTNSIFWKAVEEDTKGAPYQSVSVGPDGKQVSTPVNPSDVALAAPTYYDALISANQKPDQQNPGKTIPSINPNQAVQMALSLAKNDNGVASPYKKSVSIDPVTGQTNVTAGYVGKNPDGTPKFTQQANLYSDIDPADAGNHGLDPATANKAVDTWVKNKFGNNTDAMVPYQQIAAGNQDVRNSMIQSGVKAGVNPAQAAKIVDNTTRLVGAYTAAQKAATPPPPTPSGPSYNPQQLQDAKARGITPPPTFTDTLAAASRGIGNMASQAKQLVQAGAGNAFSSYLSQWRNGVADQGNALTLYHLVKSNPQLLAQLSPTERNDIPIKAGQSSF